MVHWEKYFQITDLTKDLYLEYTKNSQHSIVKTPKQPNQKMSKWYEEIFHQRVYTADK